MNTIQTVKTIDLPEMEHHTNVPLSWDLAAQTQSVADHLAGAVAASYLTFRRIYYHDSQPSLATPPPSHTGVQQARLAQLAESTLRLLPASVKAIPVFGGLLEHLEQVANIHSLSERERLALHNMTMLFLHGVKNGIQPWYIEWVLSSARNLSHVTHPEQFMVFPWEAIFYQDANELTAFAAARQRGDIAAIERQITTLAEKLTAALRDPIAVQVKLAFTGPAGQERQAQFHRKTQAALALGALLVAGEVHTLLTHPVNLTAPHTLLPPLPSKLLIPPPEHALA